MRIILFILVSLIGTIAYATVFMNTDSHGMVIYSDTPDKGAKPYNVKTENIISMPEATTEVSLEEKKEDSKGIEAPYQSFQITSPSDQASIQNQAEIIISFNVKPSLSNGDVIILYLDGVEAGRISEGKEIRIKEPDRGTHQLSAAILNPAGQTIMKTPAITIYVHRVNKNFRPGQ